MSDFEEQLNEDSEDQRRDIYKLKLQYILEFDLKPSLKILHKIKTKSQNFEILEHELLKRGHCDDLYTWKIHASSECQQQFVAFIYFSLKKSISRFSKPFMEEIEKKLDQLMARIEKNLTVNRLLLQFRKLIKNQIAEELIQGQNWLFENLRQLFSILEIDIQQIAQATVNQIKMMEFQLQRNESIMKKCENYRRALKNRVQARKSSEKKCTNFKIVTLSKQKNASKGIAIEKQKQNKQILMKKNKNIYRLKLKRKK